MERIAVSVYVQMIRETSIAIKAVVIYNGACGAAHVALVIMSVGGSDSRLLQPPAKNRRE